ncbi:MAG: manganese transporter [Planctomycetota bacterium]|jgi:manganese/zinc/iron transport system substrate-binding protein|nr:zinc ABC transporter substrate-binding protein [Gemmataceae bacterium]MBY0326674.1 zinc ABC transporter substrate-binding protein [Gemmataceae bacterium]NBT61320.1 manganese transporter [Planctomycetia bacterium]RLS57719.1 MAG: manganese transporter [Planctomycetota bacterium]RLS88332.1 MAG: manganese transporter [Planctomycetota bacterium]
MNTFYKIVLGLSLLLATGCKQATGNKLYLGNRQIKVVATTTMIADLLTNAGKGRVLVESLMGPGIDPHSYEPRESDVSRLMEADVVFYNGIHLEGKMADLFEESAKKKHVFAIADGLLPEDIRKEIQTNTPDPHIWFDVQLWIKCLEFVNAKLIEIDPDNSSIYETNKKNYSATLNELHQYVKQQADKVPKEQRVLITAHDAFGYFGNAYGFQVRGVQGINTVAEANSGEIGSLATFMVKNKVRAFFVESSVPRKNLEKLKEVAALLDPNFMLSSGGELYSDALGSKNSAAGTYEGMVKHNIETIVKALVP